MNYFKWDYLNIDYSFMKNLPLTILNMKFITIKSINSIRELWIIDTLNATTFDY